jgi:primosomal replication protein N
MEYNTNRVEMLGKLGKIEYSHTMGRKKFYQSYLTTRRLSDVMDVIPVIIPDDLRREISDDEFVRVDGVYRSRNYHDGEGNSHLELFIRALSIEETEDRFDDSINEFAVSGYVCKKGNIRETPAGTRICDFILAVNRAHGKTDYIPCIVWNGYAHRFDQLVTLGTQIAANGRIQSRKYIKTLDDGTEEERTAYEVSIRGFRILPENN